MWLFKTHFDCIYVITYLYYPVYISTNIKFYENHFQNAKCKCKEYYNKCLTSSSAITETLRCSVG